ncbi:unnamed protein product [Diamesa hyperborea]
MIRTTLITIMDKNSKKVAFRPRNLDVNKKMKIYLSKLPKDLNLYCADNEDISNISSGMEKAEEMEHHLQQAMSFGSVIPIPDIQNEVYNEFCEITCPPTYEMPAKLIQIPSEHVYSDLPDYDMDSSDEIWLQKQSKTLNLTPLKFEEMIDKLEKQTSKTVPNLTEAKTVLKQPDELTMIVYDYWLGKRLRTGHPMLFTIKKEEYNAKKYSNNPYIAFRRRLLRGEKMKTRRDLKSDYNNFGKMLKLRKDLMTVQKLLGMVKRREDGKKERLILGKQIIEKQYQTKDFNVIHELMSNFCTAARIRPALIPLYSNNHWNPKYDNIKLNQQRYYIPTCTITTSVDRNGFISYDVKPKSRNIPTNHHNLQFKTAVTRKPIIEKRVMIKSEDNTAPVHLLHNNVLPAQSVEDLCSNEDENHFTFHRKMYCDYHEPKQEASGEWPYNKMNRMHHPYNLTSIRNPNPRCIGFARRRVGRGGRVILDRIPTNVDTFWTQLNDTDDHDKSSFTLQSNNNLNPTSCEQLLEEINTNSAHFRPATPEPFIEEERNNENYIFESDLELYGFTSNYDFCSSFEMKFSNDSFIL